MERTAGTTDLGAGLSGQRVLVTAGAGGIGLAIAGRLIRHGARLFVCDVADAALAAFAEAHPLAGRIKADVSSEADVERPISAASTRSSTMPASPGRPAASRRSNPPNGAAASTSA